MDPPLNLKSRKQPTDICFFKPCSHSAKVTATSLKLDTNSSMMNLQTKRKRFFIGNSFTFRFTASSLSFSSTLSLNVKTALN